MKIHKKKEIKTYMFTALAMAALAVPPAVLSERMGEAEIGYLSALSSCQDQKKESCAEQNQEKKTAEETENRNLLSTGRDCIEGLEKYVHRIWQSRGYIPSPTEYNLAYLFPIGDHEEEMEEKTDISQKSAFNLLFQRSLQNLSKLGPELHQQSFGAKLFEELNEKEQNWMYRIYQELNRLPYRTGIRFRFLNGDGTESLSCSNTKEILALTNVYSYFHQWDQVQAATDYALRLWELSHQYDISVGEVYYCDGCEETDEGEMEFTSPQPETSEEAVAEQEPLSQPAESEAPVVLEAETLSDALAELEPPSEPEEQIETPSDTSDFSVCPGHVEVVVTITITGLNEQKNLFSLAASMQEPEKANDASEKNNYGGWSGWTEESQTAARELAAQDWQAKYSLKSAEMSFGRTLTKQETEAHMALLPEDTSLERRKLIACALDSVGKIPYHFGGKASQPGYAENHFFSVTEPDQMGRTLKGLDCSGWINWVYWSALGSPVTEGGTSNLAASGREITRDELKPGDIAVVPGDEAHVVMFLGWDPATGKMICIHESAGKTNNVTVSLSDRAWTHYRRILELD